jgi:hypothetical protein
MWTWLQGPPLHVLMERSAIVRYVVGSVAILSCILVGVSSARAELQVFGSFEDPAEVTAVTPSTSVHIAVSKRFPAWAGNTLEVTLPAGGGSLEYARVPEDWRWQESFLAFVWSMQPAELTLTLKDKSGKEFSRSYRLRSGVNHLQLALSEVAGLNLQAIRSLGLKSRTAGVFYLDYLALDRYHPVLEKRGRWDIDYSMEVETPHTPWARPLAGGPLKVFAIADVADGRGIVELAQRLQMDFRATTIGSSAGINKWGFGDFYEQRSWGGEFWKDAYSLAQTYIADDLIHGPRYDVILWPGIQPWESYPPEVIDALRRRVESGTGLVLFYPFRRSAAPGERWDPSPLTKTPDIKSEDSNNFNRNRFDEWDHSPWQPVVDHYITRGIPFPAFPWEQMAVPPSGATGQVLLRTLRGTPVLAVRTAGKGRVAAFAYSEKGMIPEIHDVFETGIHYSYHEYLWSLVARAVVWAAGREPAASIGTVAASTSGVAAHLANAPAGARLQVKIRSSFDETEAEGVATATPEKDSFEFKLPGRLPGGRHFAELRLLKDDRVIDWAAVAMNVPAPVVIESVAPGSDRVRAGNAVPIRLKLTATQAANCRVKVRLMDNYGRLLDEQNFDLTVDRATEREVSMRTTGALTHLAAVDCEVFVAGLRSDRRVAEVFVLQPRRWDDYDIVMYRFGPDPIPGIWPAIDRQMRRLNVTTLSSYSLSHSKHANYNVQAQTRISGQESPDGPARDHYTSMKQKYLKTGDKFALARQYCLDDPAYRELISGELKKLTAPWVPFSPMSYYVFEEPSLTCYGDAVDICFSPHTMRAFRSWLRDVYGSLDRLSRQWGTSFADWNSVVPDDAPAAQARGNYSSWADHRTYMEKTYADTFAFVLSELRKSDPEGILLNSGTQISGSHNGCDYSRIDRFTRHLNAYDDGNQLDFHRCFSPDLKISGGAGYGVLGKDVFYSFYNNLFKGSNGGAYIFWQYSTLDPDLTMSQSGKDMEAGFRELRGDGIGKLVGLATPDNHGIALHYSYPSVHGTWIVDGRMKEEVSYDTSASFGRFNANRDGWVKALKDSGLQFDFIPYGDLEQGGLISKGYKTLVLPMSVALSDKEVEAIREFVRRGGTIIADALAGIMDEHCAFRDKRALLDVFGFETGKGGAENILAGKGREMVRLTAARSMASEKGTPVLLANRYGDGRAYYLNYFLNTYPEDRREGRADAVLKGLRMVLDDAGMVPKVRLTGGDGNPASGCAGYLFNNGSTRLLGLIPDKGNSGAQRIRISFDGKAAIYDVRQKQYLGTATEFKTDIEPAVPRLFAMVKGEITGLEAKGPARVKPGDEVRIDFTVQGTADLRSVASVTVTGPDGKNIPWYGGNEDIASATGTVRFRTALNDPVGTWKVTLREALSGMLSEVKVEVR